jgi:hypothetical protein
MCVQANTNQHCGGCQPCGPGASCTNAGTQFACTCGVGQTYCGATNGCATLSSDPNNCGQCGNKCAPGAACNNGVCQCPAGTSYCGQFTGCVDLSSNASHCGSCQIQCPTGDVCTSGQCTCPGGNVQCGNTCSNVATDPNHCGNCNNVCAQGDTCNNGACACTGTMCGGNTCTTLQEDPTNCGMCGNQCQNDEACLGGSCKCRPGLTQCGGQCTDLLNDGLNCGACGVQCNFQSGQRCVQGACQNIGTCGSINQTFCNGACLTAAELASSPLNCGQCGNQCATDEVCAQGQCRPFFVSQACTTCPCPACGSGTTCCTYPGTTEAICVDGTTCPM